MRITLKTASRPRESWRGLFKRPAGFAKLDGDHYRATQEGVEWLGKIVELQILSIPQSNILQS